MTSLKKCPYCAEEILEEAKKCKYCHEILDDKLKSSQSPTWFPFKKNPPQQTQEIELFAQGGLIRGVQSVIASIGMIMCLVGVILCITVIGIIPGLAFLIFGCFVTAGILAITGGLKKILCPDCNHQNHAWAPIPLFHNKKDNLVKCRGCKRIIPIKWKFGGDDQKDDQKIVKSTGDKLLEICLLIIAVPFFLILLAAIFSPNKDKVSDANGLKIGPSFFEVSEVYSVLSNKSKQSIRDKDAPIIAVMTTRDLEGGVFIVGGTNLPPQTKVMLTLLSNKGKRLLGEAKTTVNNDKKFIAGPFSSEGKPWGEGAYQVLITVYFNSTWEQPESVLKITGKEGSNINSKYLTPNDTRFSDKGGHIDSKFDLKFGPLSDYFTAI